MKNKDKNTAFVESGHGKPTVVIKIKPDLSKKNQDPPIDPDKTIPSIRVIQNGDGGLDFPDG